MLHSQIDDIDKSTGKGSNPFLQMPFDNECCVLKKCCKAYKKKGRYCKKCPKS